MTGLFLGIRKNGVLFLLIRQTRHSTENTMNHKTLLDQWLTRQNNDISFEELQDKGWTDYESFCNESIFAELRELEVYRDKLSRYVSKVALQPWD